MTTPPHVPPGLSEIGQSLPLIEAQLATAVDELQADRGERKEFEKLVRSTIRLGALVLGVLIIVGVGSAYGVWNIIDGRSASRHAQREILDCTRPEGLCFKLAQERAALQNEEITRLVAQAQVEIEACRYRPTEQDFRACTDRALQRFALAATG